MTLDVTIAMKAKHADLYAAAKKIGGQSALARHLGVSPQELGGWCNLSAVPPRAAFGRRARRGKRNDTFWGEVGDKLLLLTGKTMDELFPPPLREAKEFLDQDKTAEFRSSIDVMAIGQATRERLTLPCPSSVYESREAKELLGAMVNRLHCREREVIKLRYGLNGGPPCSLEEVARVFRVTRERVRQIESKAKSRLTRIATIDARFKELDPATQGSA